jgi:hypothetical protein
MLSGEPDSHLAASTSQDSNLKADLFENKGFAVPSQIELSDADSLPKRMPIRVNNDWQWRKNLPILPSNQ